MATWMVVGGRGRGEGEVIMISLCVRSLHRANSGSERVWQQAPNITSRRVNTELEIAPCCIRAEAPERCAREMSKVQNVLADKPLA